ASRVTLHCYHATLDGPYELTEHRSARWLDATTLNTVAWLPADRAVLPHVLPLLRESSQVTPARQAGVAPADRPG
ncbi:MAG: hypothetical protein LBR33_11805, partial [Propionibacteriaceae bacterium]|nr:hypothetical protein [Propionibacteriaceae bacterium]